MKYFVLIIALFFTFFSFAKSSEEAICEMATSFKRNLEIIGLNIANHKTTRTPQGGTYIPQEVNCNNGTCKVVNTKNTPVMVYVPGHPDADTNGHVSYPGIDLKLERTKFQLMAERIFALAKNNKCGMSRGPSTKTFTTIYYNKAKSAAHSFIKNSQGEIIIWEVTSSKGNGSFLNLLTGKGWQKKLPGEHPQDYQKI